MPNTGLAGASSTATPIYAVGQLAAGALARGTIVKEDSSGNLTTAGDGDDVFGVLACDAVASSNALVQVGGVIRLDTTASPGFTRPYQDVVAAGSNQVDAGTAGNPALGYLLHYDSENLTAAVQLAGTALRVPARALFDGQGFSSFPVGSLTNSRPLVLSGGSVATPLRQGATGSRPGSNFTGQSYFDTTLLEDMIYNGTRFQSASLHDAVFARTNAVSAGTNVLSFAANAVSSDAGVPFFCPTDCRFVAARFSLIGGTGGKTWTARLRLNGSGSDTWTSSGRSSTTSWATTDETIDQAFSQGDRIQLLVDTGTNESGRWSIWFGYYKT